jgi:hypothetical protein
VDVRTDPRAEPVFYAGIAFEPATPAAIEALTNPAWTIPAQFGFNRWTTRNIFVPKLLYLGELVVRGVVLSEQAQQFADWATQAFEDLLALPDARNTTPVVPV